VCPFLVAFRYSQRESVNFVISVCLFFTCISWAPTNWIFVKLNIGNFHWNVCGENQNLVSWTELLGSSHEDLKSVYACVCVCVFLCFLFLYVIAATCLDLIMDWFNCKIEISVVKTIWYLVCSTFMTFVVMALRWQKWSKLAILKYITYISCVERYLNPSLLQLTQWNDEHKEKWYWGVRICEEVWVITNCFSLTTVLKRKHCFVTMVMHSMSILLTATCV
jgi:hypothetical protein